MLSRGLEVFLEYTLNIFGDRDVMQIRGEGIPCFDGSVLEGTVG